MRSPLLLLALLTCAALPAAGQRTADPGGAYPVDAGTRVRAVRFAFDGDEVVSGRLLEEAVALQDSRTLSRLARRLSGRGTGLFGQSRQRFDPAELVRDLERLRRLLARQGYPSAEVRFSLDVDTEENLVDVTYQVTPGPPRRVGTVRVEAWDGAPLPQGLPVDVVGEWPRGKAAMAELEGQLASETTLRRLEAVASDWFADRGYASASASASARPQPAGETVDVDVRVEPGPRLRIDSIAVAGLEALDRDVVLRELPFRPGDWVSQRQVVEGRRHVMALDIVRLALAEVEATSDSTARVKLRVEEAPLHLVTGDVRYRSRSGPELRVSWDQRNFLGNARVFSLEGRVSTGTFTLVEQSTRVIRLSAGLRTPHFLDRRLALSASVFGETFRDEVFTARRLGMDGLLAFVQSPRFTLSFVASVARRWVDEYRVAAALSRGLDVFDAIEAAEAGFLSEVGGVVGEADLALEAVLGPTDRDPRRELVWTVRPRITGSGPGFLSDIQYLGADVNAELSVPLGSGVTLRLRGGAGHLHPYGSSIPDSASEALASSVRLRRVMLTAGGSSDVRGWAASQLGPKYPDVVFFVDGDSASISAAGTYVPLGGQNRLMTSAQLELPLPLVPDWLEGLVFVDGGRIWTRDSRFGEDGEDELGQQRFFWAAGGGFVIRSPVGRIEASLGVKLNPSLLDLAPAADLADALLDGRPLEEVPRQQRRRLQLHLSVGVGQRH